MIMTNGRFGRRKFIQQLGMGSAALLALRSTRAAEAGIEVLLNEPIGTIAPELYGHFAENIGGVIYDGIWVGEDSTIPNVGGIRQALVDHLKQIKPPVIRWPGGCFADSYDWHDGIGPRAQRPRRTNFWINDGFLQRAPDGPQKYDPNQFGTNEFAHFCRLVGAEPYLAANVRSLTPKDFYEWVEYCNGPAGKTTLAQQRAAAGDREPFNIRYWGVGNESWGCGGNFTPEEYATEFRRFTAWVPNYGKPLALIGSGPSGGDMDWTRRFFTHLTQRDRGLLRLLHGWAMHYYCGTAGKGDAIDFTVPDWYELLEKAIFMEALIQQQWQAMGEVDRQHRIKLIVDEWGAWHHAGTEVDPAYLFGQTSTLRDALVAALTLDIFNRHADKVAMANVAQLINNLHSLFLAREDQFVVTPNYHVFAMYAAHQGGQSVRTSFAAPPLEYPHASKDQRLPALSGSASLKGKQLVLTVVNPDDNNAREADVSVRGARIQSGQARLLTASDIHAHNSFSEPRGIEPSDQDVNVSGGRLTFSFPGRSVTRLILALS
jgi:alpha-N-arabinofuranosidase